MVKPAERSSTPSLAASRAIVLVEAERRGWRELNRSWLKEAGLSDQDLERPGLAAALDGLRQRRVRALVLSRDDEIERALLDLARLMDTATREAWALVALDVDLPAPPGHSVVATFAPYDRRRNAERTRAIVAARRARGLPVGRTSSIPKPVVDRILAEHRAGLSLHSIADRLNADGIKGSSGGRWYASTVRHALQVAERERHAADALPSSEASVDPRNRST